MPNHQFHGNAYTGGIPEGAGKGGSSRKGGKTGGHISQPMMTGILMGIATKLLDNGDTPTDVPMTGLAEPMTIAADDYSAWQEQHNDLWVDPTAHALLRPDPKRKKVTVMPINIAEPAASAGRSLDIPMAFSETADAERRNAVGVVLHARPGWGLMPSGRAGHEWLVEHCRAEQRSRDGGMSAHHARLQIRMRRWSET